MYLETSSPGDIQHWWIACLTAVVYIVRNPILQLVTVKLQASSSLQPFINYIFEYVPASTRNNILTISIYAAAATQTYMLTWLSLAENSLNLGVAVGRG